MYEGNAATIIGRRVGNYVVERSLAQGNMGSVFVARHPALGREAAVKFLGRDLDVSPEMTKRFLDEARITANLRHPNIVDIFDFGELDGRLYYVMELLDGLDLAGLMRAKQRFTNQEVVDFLRQVCSGLAAAHAVGVVHRDLKPGNIFVVRGAPARLKLMDFGVAKVLSTTGEQTHHGQIIGTPRYMCPEQALGQIERIGPQSDIYSLGVIAYEMLAGRCPFEHQSPVMLLVMHVHHEACPLDALAPETPAWLVALIEACLAKDPSNRPASAQDILAEIARHCPVRSTNAEYSPIALPLTSGISMVAHSETRISTATATSAKEPATQMDATTASMVSERSLGNDSVQPAATIDSSPRRAEASSTAAVATNHDSVQPTATIDSSPRRAERSSATLTTVLRTPPPDVPETELHASPPRNGLPHELAGARLTDAAVVTSSSHPRPASAHVELTEADRSVLNRLLFRMQRRGDFPAFVQNVGEVNKRADFESSFSAEQLGTAILKDYALTAKLLRIVNSAYANRFGGRIYSVRHAIVILGFDRVRSLALSTSLFKSQGNKKHAGRISESAINSLVSGEIARQVSSGAQLDDSEQATICSMFRNLGRHLVLVYLPETYDEILALMERQGIGMEAAAERILGLSMHKLGVGIAERWRLPSRIIAAMRTVPERASKLTREEDKLAALADFSNHLCEIVIGEYSGDERSAALRNLLGRHKNLIHLEDDELNDLMLSTQKSFEQRYASLLGAATKSCRFAQAVATLSGSRGGLEQTIESPAVAVSGTVAAAPTKQLVTAPPATQENSGAPFASAAYGGVQIETAQSENGLGPRRASGGGATRENATKPQVTRLQLAKYVDPEAPDPQKPQSESNQTLELLIVQAMTTPLQASAPDQLVGSLLKCFAEQLDVPRVLALRATQNRRELVTVAGVGEDIEGIMKELRLPLLAARTASDPFSLCFHAHRDFFIEDVFAQRVVSTLPQRYFEVLGSSSLGLISCTHPSSQPLVLLVDLDPPRQLPCAERLANLARARAAIARVAPPAGA